MHPRYKNNSNGGSKFKKTKKEEFYQPNDSEYIKDIEGSIISINEIYCQFTFIYVQEIGN